MINGRSYKNIYPFYLPISLARSTKQIFQLYNTSKDYKFKTLYRNTTEVYLKYTQICKS